ncbi:MAG: diacylglycerol kinase family lipid kinase [Spirochaetaceae bacterium]|nr:MAG: diacylglycerol kinase family lipid kinase [Spirochaetaceae bacterium]
MPVIIHLIVNPNAGRRKGLTVADRARTLLEPAGFTVTTHVSTYPGHAIELAAGIGAELAARPATGPAAQPSVGAYPAERAGVIALGGDGTLFEVINGLMRGATGTAYPGAPLPCPVGQIPLGTGNSFIQDLGLSTAEEAIQAILTGRTRPVDLGTLTCAAGTYSFINCLGAGFVSSVAHRAERYKRFGALSYVIGVLQETIALAPGELTLTVDGSRMEREALFVEICNSRYTGGNMMMAPGARIDDGLLDVVLMSRTTRRKLLTLFPSIFSGKHVEDPVIEVFRGRSISLRTATPWRLTPDGETFGSTPITVGILPAHLEMFCR